MKNVVRWSSGILKRSFCCLVPLAALFLWSCNLLGNTGAGSGGTVPSAPTGISAATTTTGDGEVTVTWSPVSGAASYNIYWAKGSSVTTASGTELKGVSSPAIVNDLSQGSQYSFTVTAVDSAGESGAGTTASDTIPTTSSHVYMGGNVEGYPAYWKDGVLHLLGTNQGYSASEVTAAPNGTVYAACFDFTQGTNLGAYWDNGTMKSLPLNSGESIGWFAGIVVSGSNVYIAAGVNEPDGTQLPVLWTNGVRSVLPLGTDAHGNPAGMQLVGSDVYVVGETYTTDSSGNWTDDHMVYWKNGALTVLSQGAGYAWGWFSPVHSGGGGMFVQGSDLYIYGETYGSSGVPIYWKNFGSPAYLPSPNTSNDYSALDFFATGTSLYVAGDAEPGGDGTKATPAYWQGTTEHVLPLPSGVSVGSAQGIVVSGGTTYIVGDEAGHDQYYSKSDPAVPLYWENGVLKTLSLPSGDSNAKVEGMALSGTDVYIAARTGTVDPTRGDISSSSPSHAVYWKNGTMNILPTGQYVNGSLDSLIVLPY